MRSIATLAVCLAAIAAAAPAPSRWPKPLSPVVPEADGYAPIPGAAVPPSADRVYKAIFDATRRAARPAELVPAVNNAASELNAFGVAGVPLSHAKFALVFHGGAMDGLLDDAHYRAKFGVPNPNLPVLARMRKSGVEILVCGQNLVADDVDRTALTPDVTIASDALIVLMTYENDGYALLSF
ncbi:MAG TPA: DsrE family protein [Thermoanaerobaculia bacterium]|nr:DsrE family protein [Thermoanaerobaculia bacterium]